MDSNSIFTAKRLGKLFWNAEISVAGAPEGCTADFDDLVHINKLNITSSGDEKSVDISVSVNAVDVGDDSLKFTWEDEPALTVTEYDTLTEE